MELSHQYLPWLNLLSLRVATSIHFYPQQSVEKYFTEITDTVRVLDELQSGLAMAKEFEMVLAETGKLLKHRSTSHTDARILSL